MRRALRVVIPAAALAALTLALPAAGRTVAFEADVQGSFGIRASDTCPPALDCGRARIDGFGKATRSLQLLALSAPASADQPDVFGPFEYDVQYSFDNCGFQADVSLHGTFTNRGFWNPERNINYIREEGTVVNPATGTTLLIKNAWTELGRPPQTPDEGWGTFVERGVRTHIRAPGGGTIVLDAGYLHYRYPDGFVFVAHGRHHLELEGDIAELCAALAA